jgi:nucleoside-diphosphate-sugar epimerase
VLDDLFNGLAGNVAGGVELVVGEVSDYEVVSDPRVNSHADLEAARVDFGYQPAVPLEEGLRLTLAARG